jgi:hypothetical protein
MTVLPAMAQFPDPGGGGFYVSFQSPAAGAQGQDCLFQYIPTVPGQRYMITFYIAITAAAGPNTEMDPEWDAGGANNTRMRDPYYYFPTNTGPQPFRQFTFTETASLSNTLVFFHATNATGSILLDNVVATAISATPEPGSLLLMSAGLLLFVSLAADRIRRKCGKESKSPQAIATFPHHRR